MNQEATKKSETDEVALTTTNATTSTTSDPSLASFPDVVNTCLLSFLRTRELKRLRISSPSLLQTYGGKWTALTLLWPDDLQHFNPDAFWSLIGRQERLRSVILKSYSLLPPLLVSISHGHCRYLTDLSLRPNPGSHDELINNSDITHLVHHMSAGELPNLQVLHLDGKFARGGTGILRDGLRNGACPKLESIGVFDRGNFDTSDIHIGTVAMATLQSFHADRDAWMQVQNEGMDAVVELVESRQNLPGCSPIKKLGCKPCEELVGSDDVVRERLLRALRPFIEEFVFERSTTNMASMIKEMGAPCLKELQVSDRYHTDVNLFPWIEALNSIALPSTGKLRLGTNALDTACVDRLLGLLRSEHHHLLPPHLTYVSIEADTFKLAVDGDRFFRSLGKEEGVFFPSSVKELLFSPDDSCQSSIQSVASALARGAVPGLEELDILCTIKDGFATLCQALVTTTWVKQLKYLGLQGCAIMNAEDARVLTDVFEQGGLPCLQEFFLANDEGPEGQDVTCLIDALKASRHASLRTLVLHNVRMSDAGMVALASAAEEGGCFIHLEKLDLSANKDVTDMGVLALSNAIAARCMPKLAKLSIYGTSIDQGGASAVALLSSLLTHCLDFETISFPIRLSGVARQVIDGVLEGLNKKRAANISILYGYAIDDE